ncbi:hypothetical protein BDV28DRAFT_144237 [Aspergillus coremiiformis]|uniref:Uncharacterized protein n=1 Tax=Aspergillus coremiiformis TaxID=138285 RepID=A0A5N6YRL5_9EURO|nr:hypothetical protein BDV28DRAFT_144237 [Aspergillus coremiiformis]
MIDHYANGDDPPPNDLCRVVDLQLAKIKATSHFQEDRNLIQSTNTFLIIDFRFIWRGGGKIFPGAQWRGKSPNGHSVTFKLSCYS